MTDDEMRLLAQHIANAWWLRFYSLIAGVFLGLLLFAGYLWVTA